METVRVSNIKAIKDGQSYTRQSLEQLIEICQNLATFRESSSRKPSEKNGASGILRVESSHHLWNLVFVGGTMVLIDEEEHLVPTLIRKFKALKLNFQELNNIAERKSEGSDRLNLYQIIQQIYKQESEAAQRILREIIQENLLAIFLENSFDLTWQAKPEIAQISLLQTPFINLQQITDLTVQQWKTLLHVRHPFQQVILLDADDPIASVPLFATATTGQYRISEIADRFRQDISRTAFKLDRLAEKRTVAILPLPLRPPKPEPRSPKKNVSKVFVVDDSPVLLKQLGSLIEAWGYEVSMCSDAVSAVEKMLIHKPNIIFLDLNMPGTNGFEMIKQIRRQPELSTTPLVMITAENNVANNFRAKWASCKFLGKPKSTNETAEFRQQLRSLLRELAPLSTDTLV